MLAVALTGGIGVGKSTAARFFAERGAVVVDADEVARAVVEPGTPALAQIVERFGPGILGSDGRLDRPALAALVFADDEARRDLELIVHPAVRAETWRRRELMPSDAVFVYDVPLLTTNVERFADFDLVVLVEAPRAQRMARLVARGLTQSDAEARIAAQPTEEEGRALADVVLDNAGTVEDLERQVDRLWPDLLARS